MKYNYFFRYKVNLYMQLTYIRKYFTLNERITLIIPARSLKYQTSMLGRQRVLIKGRIKLNSTLL